MPTTTTDSNTSARSPQVASPNDASRWLAERSAVLIDVREADEHARERIPGTLHLPLSRFDPAEAAAIARPGVAIVFYCRSGRRSADACRIAAAALPEGAALLTLDGGIQAWKAQGLPIAAPRGGGGGVSVLRQTQLVIGVGVLLSVVLGWLVHPALLGLAAFLGAGLAVAGATGTCGLATLLVAMPWNRSPLPNAKPGDRSSCAAESCACSHN